MEEIFKKHPEYGFLVSNMGYVIKRKDGEPTYPTQRKDTGYYVINVGGGKTKRIHRIVMETFSPNPDPSKYTDVNHIDGDKSNNRLDNLEWVTRGENIKKAYDIGLRKQLDGLNSPNVKLTKEQYQDIYDRYEIKADGRANTTELAKEYNISNDTIKYIIQGHNGKGKIMYEFVDRTIKKEISHLGGLSFQIDKIDKDTGEILETYDSIKEAMRNSGTTLRRYLDNDKIYKGFKWKHHKY